MNVIADAKTGVNTVNVNVQLNDQKLKGTGEQNCNYLIFLDVRIQRLLTQHKLVLFVPKSFPLFSYHVFA